MTKLLAILATLAVLRYAAIADVNVSFVFVNSALGSSGGDLNTAGAAPAVDMALAAINDSPSLLPGYVLDYGEALNSEASPSYHRYYKTCKPTVYNYNISAQFD